MFTGAFNSASAHYERLIDIYRQVGDVRVVEYPKLRFDAYQVMLATYEFARLNGYTEIIVVGASLGGEESFLFEEQARAYAHQYNMTIKRVMCDVAGVGTHLLPPPWMLQIAKLLHIDPRRMPPLWLLKIVKGLHAGPLFNLLSPFVTRLVFQKIPLEQSNGVDPDHLDRHMRALWGRKISAILEQIAAVVAQRKRTNVGWAPTVYIKCAHDEVIKAEESLSYWRTVLGDSLIGVIFVEGGHIQFVEYHTPVAAAHVQALRMLGYVVR